jgi:hypothetical protein
LQCAGTLRSMKVPVLCAIMVAMSLIMSWCLFSTVLNSTEMSWSSCKRMTLTQSVHKIRNRKHHFEAVLRWGHRYNHFHQVHRTFTQCSEVQTRETSNSYTSHTSTGEGTSRIRNCSYAFPTHHGPVPFRDPPDHRVRPTPQHDERQPKPQLQPGQPTYHNNCQEKGILLQTLDIKT